MLNRRIVEVEHIGVIVEVGGLIVLHGSGGLAYGGELGHNRTNAVTVLDECVYLCLVGVGV